ncbi:MAG: biotin-dependent carboxyltransferase family protein [Gammaproteobacteria bacterium]|nr:MAG: biotin-dependent carboxyltransferase family protein [Gammaproteobacteria bacterium]
MSIEVLEPGLLTTVQDCGRHGYRHLGVGQSGVLDSFSAAVANILVGNSPGSPLLEMTLRGPVVRFSVPARIAICGAGIDVHCGDLVLPLWRRIDLAAGSTLHFGACRSGARAYLAVNGGFEVDPILGSTSTDLRAGFPGLAGRQLQAGDRVRLAHGIQPDCSEPRIARCWANPSPELDFKQTALVHLLPGSDQLADADALHSTPWTIGSASNRQGLRLSGASLQLRNPREAISEPVMPGTVQLPADGNPILLLADAQTHGGYARIGHAIRADWPRLAQLRPGERMYFVPCSTGQASRLWRRQQQGLARLAIAVSRADQA